MTGRPVREQPCISPEKTLANPESCRYIWDMNQLSCTISSLTPIVTGDHEHRNTELLATGILGSLRYQYWLLKAMQAWQKKQSYPHCSADLPPAGSKNFTEELRKAGPVVQLFGATNWKKMFRLEIAEAEKSEKQACSARSDWKGHPDIDPWQWTFKLTFRQDRTSPIFAELAQENGTSLEKELHSLMAFVHQHGWLGAAPQNGLGWVTVQNDGLERISLPEKNPVFAAKDVLFSKQEADRLRAELIRYYEGKGTVNRYAASVRHLKRKPYPVGYEIRRWLRDKKKPSFFFGGKDRAGVDHAGFVHVTHPVVQSDGSWRIRMRFTVRPDDNGGINPIAKPADWLDDCEKLLKSV
jgi:CRISPR type III-B/RAMP module RAMP protein Cmr1